ncbi:AAA family ATPase [Methylocapsa aurea]|uniref:AAA family ATPase n=1 Tax=Methylocapsa aurea TaxID=663610 RepID=UPI00068F0F37|nr:AAA family ATPase [Methylocapsa aurea]
MRILAVRGENLASLAAPFEIDFCREPLAGAGLFAITGETGAGKSTILDAICLALYGAYPRVAIDRSEQAPDPGGKEISGKDARALLRRGAGKGFAEVDFQGVDGDAYRVRWEVFRARGRANGALQKPQRSLIRIADLQPIASGVQPVLEKVQQLTDFTFDQFRRTVLLAQGEFDAFLLASENERAELLEKVTGTEIYAAISRRAYEEKERRGNEMRSLEERRAGVGLLDEAERISLANERVELIASARASLQAIDALQQRLEHESRRAVAREKCALATSALEVAALGWKTLAPERAELADLDRIEPLRPKAALLTQARQGLADAQTAFAEANGLHAAAREAAENAALARQSALALDLEAEDRFKAFGPLWTRCEQLDATINHLRLEHEKAEAQRDKTRMEADAHAATLQGLEALATQTSASRDSLATKLEACSASVILADRCDEAEALLLKRSEFKTRRQKAHAAFVRASKEAQRLRSLIVDLDLAADAMRGERDRLNAENEARRVGLAAIGEDHLRERDSALASLLGGLADAASILDRHARAQHERIEAKTASAAAMREIEGAETQLLAATQTQANQRAARAEILGLIDLADATASPEAIHLRAALVPGAPCPVCGGADHPHADQADAGAEFVARIRARRTELDQSLAAAAHLIETARGARAGAAARHDHALRRDQLALAELEAAAEAYALRRDPLDCSRAALGFPDALPHAPEAALAPVLQLAAIAKAERETLADPLGQAKALRADLELLRRKLSEAASDLEGKLAELEARRRALHEFDVERSSSEAQLRELDDRLLSIDRELGPFLAAADLTSADVDLDALAAAAQVKARGQTYRQEKARLAGDEAALQALNPKLAAAREAAQTAIKSLDNAIAETAGRAEALRLAECERGLLLEGEPTAAHRTRHNELRRQARARLDDARDAEAEAGKALAAAANGEAGALANQEALRLQLIEAERNFTTAIVETGLPVDRVGALLEAEPAAREALRAKLDAIEAAQALARANLDERQRDLDELLARDGSEIDAEALRTDIANLQDGLDETQRRSGAIDNQIAADDAARAGAAALTARIESAQADFAIWQAIDDAIGSASGDKFRRFAQGVTLDQLIALANRHLAAFAPRYRLERAATSDLSVHVIDRDMGDERRAARSLSGGERFLASLSLAIALSGLEGRQAFVDTLFVDEGFGSLDAETLDVAIDALESLHGRGRKVGVITHVAAMIERIAVQVRVEKCGNGRSTVRVAQPGGAALLEAALLEAWPRG